MHESIDDTLKELETALDVRPSAAFAANVRNGIAPERRAAWRWLVPMLLTAFTLAVIVVGTRDWRGRPVAPSRPPAKIGAAAPDARVTSTAPAVIRATRSVRPSQSVLHPRTEQELALMLLLVEMRTANGTVPRTVAPRFDEDGFLVEPAPVMIRPVTIEPLPGPVEIDGAGLKKQEKS